MSNVLRSPLNSFLLPVSCGESTMYQSVTVRDVQYWIFTDILRRSKQLYNTNIIPDTDINKCH